MTVTGPSSGALGRDTAAARLRALMEIAKVTGAARTVEQVLRAASDRARDALGASSLSVSRWERDKGIVRTLVNAGRLAPGEQAFPDDETYVIDEFPALSRSFGDGFGGHYDIEDPDVDAAEAAFMRRTGVRSAVIVPIMLEGRAWGELYASRTPDLEPFGDGDVEFAQTVAAQIAAGMAHVEHFERVQRLAYTDALTGLANRRAVDELLDGAISRHRAEGTVVSLVVCDVNGLKRRNDEVGHDAGDRLLMEVATVLAAASARFPSAMAGRLGGDEFCLVVEQASADEVVAAAHGVCGRLLDPDGHPLVSCGVASTADPVGPVRSPARLFRLADTAQYRAKRAAAMEPVVAGRALPAAATTVPAERRALRGRGLGRTTALLDSALATLDAVTDDGVQPRLEAVASSVAGSLDAAGWWVSRVDAGGDHFLTVAGSLTRVPAHVSGTTLEAVGERFPLSDYPMSAEALRGGAFEVVEGEVGNDPGEEALLAAAEATGMLVAGVTVAGVGWLVEIYFDVISVPPDGLAPELRLLVAAAVTAGSAAAPG